ncbi:MAG: lipopolysaccharide heptosyltransferase II [Planctomycetota bacterium]|jgi:heptosyltransferase-2
MQETNTLIWLPSPLGDAVLCTPALRAIRQHFKSDRIFFFANPTVRQTLTPCCFNDEWLEQNSNNPFKVANFLKKYNFHQAILFKNSFASVLSCFLAGIPVRVGYSREGRGLFLTEKLYPAKHSRTKFKPVSMINYYCAIACWFGADTSDRTLELTIGPEDSLSLKDKLPEIFSNTQPVVVLVPGGAFGPSKCWPAERYAETADRLISEYNATVVVSVAPNPMEQEIAQKICDAGKNVLINLAESPVSLGELKALFAVSDLVITNDTGPRHIAVALGRKVITLFGPNNPTWTDTGYEDEIKIVGKAPCAPCHKSICKKERHWCMEAITVNMVCSAVEKLLNTNRPHSIKEQQFVEISDSFFVDGDFKKAFEKLGLNSIGDVFSFKGGEILTKDNLTKHRSRLRFQTENPVAVLFLKRYDTPSFPVQIKNWINHRRRDSLAFCEVQPAKELARSGINTPKTVCFGQQWGMFFEKRSFIVTEKIPSAESLERKMPDYFYAPVTSAKLRLRKDFILRLADFIKKFHNTNYRHRDLYLSHIFYDDNEEFHLIDLARAFKPVMLSKRFTIKDIAQLHYSAPSGFFSKADRIRFYLRYADKKKLTPKDKRFIYKVKRKITRMAKHDIKHNRVVPFAS